MRPSRSLMDIFGDSDPEPWPTGWDLAAQRCRGLNGAGRQCSRRTREAQETCYAHGEQTAKHVKETVQARLDEQVRKPSGARKSRGAVKANSKPTGKR